MAGGGAISTGDLWQFTRTRPCQRISNMHLASVRAGRTHSPYHARGGVRDPRQSCTFPSRVFPPPARPPPCPVSLCGWRRLLALFPGAGCINSGLRKSRVEFWKTPYFFSPPEDFSSVTQTPSCGGPLRGRSGCLHVLVRTVCLEARVRSV